MHTPFTSFLFFHTLPSMVGDIHCPAECSCTEDHLRGLHHTQCVCPSVQVWSTQSIFHFSLEIEYNHWATKPQQEVLGNSESPFWSWCQLFLVWWRKVGIFDSSLCPYRFFFFLWQLEWTIIISKQCYTGELPNCERSRLDNDNRVSLHFCEVLEIVQLINSCCWSANIISRRLGLSWFDGRRVVILCVCQNEKRVPDEWQAQQATATS